MKLVYADFERNFIYLVVEKKECPSDWLSFNDKCYKSGGDDLKLDYDNAQKYCQDREAILVEICSQEEQDFIFNSKYCSIS